MRGPIRISDLPFNSEEIWCEVLTMASHRRAALFLDRDGVVVEDKEYLWRKEDIVMIPGAAGAIAAANNCGIAVVLVTNQAVIGRGYYGWTKFRAVQRTIVGALAAEGARFDGVYACAHLPEEIGGFAHPDHPTLKPNPGMLLQAARVLGLDLKKLMAHRRQSD